MVNNKVTDISCKIIGIPFVGENSYFICKARALIEKKIHNISIKGILPTPSKGSVLVVSGILSKSDKYGYCIDVTEAHSEIDEESALIVSFLSTMIKGMPYEAAVNIAKDHGKNFASILCNPSKLIKYKGIGPIVADKIQKSFVENKHTFELFELTNGSISANMLKKICEKYGKKAVKIIKDNPYQLIYDFNGIGFAKADKIAKSMGLSHTSVERFKAGIVYALEDANTKQGHLFLYKPELEEIALETLFPSSDLKRTFYEDVLKTVCPSPNANSDAWDSLFISKMNDSNINKMVQNWLTFDEKQQIFYSEKYTKMYNLTSEEVDTIDTYVSNRNDFTSSLTNLLLEEEEAKHIVIEDNCIYKESIYALEKYTAANLVKLYKADALHNNVKIKCPTKEHIKKAIMNIEKEEGHDLGDLQVKAVATSLSNSVSVITGGPGRGKTTIIKTIIKGWTYAGNSISNVVLLAPTGRAAQRMKESTGYQAYTIQRFLLQVGMVSNSIILIDEFSMVDIYLFASILKAFIDNGNVIVFVGDVNQLPSVGPGRILKDIINSNIIPTTYLLKCYRNSGSIASNVDAVNEGIKFGSLTWDYQFKFSKFTRDTKDKMAEYICNLYKEYINEFGNKEVAILCCRRQNCSLGSDSLNKIIQNNVNPKTSANNSIRIPNTDMELRENDRVMHIVNDYKIEVDLPIYDDSGNITNYYNALGCFNGETGTVIKIDSVNKFVTVEFDDGKRCIYNESNLREITLAYAITVHKSQGSEYKAIIHMETSDDFMMLDRNILYTAISRGKQVVHLLGYPESFNTAINHVSTKIRNSNLDKKIVEAFYAVEEIPCESSATYNYLPVDELI